MELNLVNYSYTAKMMIIIFCTSFFFAMKYLVKTIEIKEDDEEYQVKVKKIGNRNYKERLSKYVDRMNEDIDSKKKLYDSLGEDTPVHLTLGKMVASTLSSDNPAKYLTILFIGLLIGIVSSAMMMYSTNPLIVPVVFAIYAFSTLTIINAVRTVDNYRRYRDTVDLITLIHTNYQNKDSIVDAMLDLQSTLIPLDPKKELVDEFVNNVKNINLDLEKSLEIMRKSLVDTSQVRQYFSIILKAEEESKVVKKSLNDIPENLALMSISRKDYTGAVALVGLFILVTLLMFTFSVVLKYSFLNPQLESIIKDFPKVAAGSIIFLISNIIAYIASKIRKN